MSNAGGVNPHGCVQELREAAREQGVELSVALVEGDEMIDRVQCVLQCECVCVCVSVCMCVCVQVSRQ